MKFFILNIFILSLCTTIASGQNYVANDGLYELRNNWGLDKDSFKTCKVWIKDSITIHEEKAHFSYDSSEINIYSGYETYKYVYTDLRKKQCQDYYSFSDTAHIGCNYLKSDNCFSLPQINPLEKYCSLDSLTKMEDTVINENLYKRIKYRERHDDYNYSFEYTYYLIKQTRKSALLFKNCAIIENLYPGHIIERIDYYNPLPAPHIFISEAKVIRNYFTKEEDKIFEEWKLKAANTSLPVIPCEKVRLKKGIPVTIRNNPRFKNFIASAIDVQNE